MGNENVNLRSCTQGEIDAMVLDGSYVQVCKTYMDHVVVAVSVSREVALLLSGIDKHERVRKIALERALERAIGDVETMWIMKFAMEDAVQYID
jgi:hypothetical protein